MFLTEYDEAKHMRRLSRDSFAAGKKEGHEQGLQQGIHQGRQQGLQEGIQQGRQEGIQQGLQDSIMSLYKKGRITAMEAAEELDINEAEFIRLFQRLEDSRM